MKSSGKTLRLILTGSILAAVHAHAVTYTWDGGNASGNWSNAGVGGNWSGGVVPVSSASATDLIFASNTNGQVSVNNLATSPFLFNSMTFNAGLPAFTLNGANPFQGTTQAIITDNLANNVTIGALLNLNLQNNQNVTLANNGAGTLTMSGGITGLAANAGNNVLNITGSGNTTISGQINQAGAVGLVTLKTGSGTLTFSGASNNQTGTQQILQGMLTLDYSTNNSNKMAATSALRLGGTSGTIQTTGNVGITNAAQAPVVGVLSSVTVNVVGNSSAATSQTVGGVTLDPGAATVNVTSNNAGGATLTTGTITHNFGGTVNFNLINTTGTAAVNVAQTGTGGTIGGWATLGLNDFVAGGGNITAATYAANNDVSTWAAAANISDGGAAYTNATNNLTINSLRFDTAAASTVTVNAGQTLQIGNTTQKVGGILVTSNVGANATTIAGGQLTASIAVNDNNPHELIIHQNNTAAALTISSNIVNNPGQNNRLSLTKSGAGQLILSGSNSFSGTLYLNAGELQLNSSTAWAGGAAAVLSGGTFTLNGNNATIGNSAVAAGLSGVAGTIRNASASPATLTVAQWGAGTYGGIISDGSGGGALSLTKTSSQTLTLTNTNTYTGALTVSGGTIAYATDAILGGATTISLNNADRAAGAVATLNNTGAISNWQRLVSIDAVLRNQVVALNTGGNVTFNGSGTRGITGGNSTTTIVKSGTGQLTLSDAGTADYIGNWRLDAGTLALSGADETKLGNANNDILFNGGTLANSSSSSDLNFASTRTLTLLLVNVTGTSTGSNLTTGGAAGGIIINEANQLTGLGGFTKSNSGTMNISASQNFGGYQTVSVTGGTLKVNSDSALGASSNLLSFNAATLELGAAFNTARIIALPGTLTIDAGGFAMTASGIISGVGGLTRTGGAASTLTLSGTNTYTGATTLNVGTLKLAGATAANGTVGPLGVGSAVTVNTGAILDLDGNNTTIGNIAGSAGEIKLGAGTLTTGLNTANTQFTGQITGGGSLIKLGTGTQTLQGDNTFAGTVTVTNGSAGTIILSGASAAGKLSGVTAITVAGGGTLQAGSSTNSENTAARVNSAATLTLGDSTQGSGTFTLGLRNAVLTQNLASVTLNAGLDSLTTASTGTGAQILGFNGAGTLLTRNTGSALFVSTATNFLVNFSTGTIPTNSNNILGGYAFIGGANNTSNASVTNFASIDGSNNLVAGPQGGYTTQNAIGSWALNENITNNGAWTGSVAASVAINSLRIANNAAGTINIDDLQTLTLASGGLLNSSTAATGTQLIAATSGTADLTSGNGTDLIVYQSGGSALTFGTGLRISGSIGLTIVKTGAGALTLGGGAADSTANTYNGTTTVMSGAVVLNKAANTAVIPGDLSVFGGTVTLTAARAGQIATASNVILRGGTLDLTSNAVTLASLNYQTGSSVTNMSGGLTLSGSAAEVLTFGNNTLSTLGAAINQLNLTSTSGGGIRYNGFSSAAILLPNLNLGSPGTPFQRVINVDDGNQTTDLAISGTIAGTNGIEKTGLGRLDLTTATNGFSGGIKISNGILGVDTDARLGAAANSIVLNGGELRINGNLGTVGASRTITVNNVSGNVIDITGVGNNEVTLGAANQLTGSGSLLVVGTGNASNILALNAAQNYSGALTIGGNVVNYGAYTTGGVVKLGASGALGSVASITLNNNGQLRNDFVGTQTFGAGVPLSLNGNTSINTNNGSITFNGATTASAQGMLSLVGGNAVTFGGTVTGSGNLSTGTAGASLVFSQSNSSTYSGNLYAPSGTIRADAAGALGTGTVTLGRLTAAGGTLRLTGTNAFSLSNSIVVLGQGTDLTRAAINVGGTAAAFGRGMTGTSGSVYTFSGPISGNGSLAFGNASAANGTLGIAEIVLSGTYSATGAAGIQVNTNVVFNAGGGGMNIGNSTYLHFANPAALPTGAANNTTAYLSGFSRNGTQDMGYIFDGSATPYTLANTAAAGNASYKIALGSIGTGLSGGGMIGADGSATLRSDVLLHRDSTAGMGLLLLARDSSVFTLGDGTQAVRFQNTAGSDSALNTAAQLNATATTVTDNVGVNATGTLTKRGEGTVVLGNIGYTLADGTALANPTAAATVSTSNFAWQIGRATVGSNAGANANFDGAVRGRSTFNDDATATLANSLFSGAASGNFVLALRGGVYEIDANGGSPRTFTAALGSTANAAPQVNWGAGGGGFSAFGGPVNVTISGLTANWASTTNFIGNGEALVFGSKTADNILTFTRAFGLASSGFNASTTREVRVLDNTGSATDRAVFSGDIYDSQAAGGGSQSAGTGTRGLLKSGAGSLELQGTGSTYNGATTIGQGTLLAGGNVPAQGAGAGVLGQPAVGFDTIVINNANTGTNNTALLTNGAFTIARPITVAADGSGTVTLGGNSDHNSTFSGTITLNRDLRITSATTGANRVTVSNTIDDGAGSFSVTKVGTGTLDLNGAQTYATLTTSAGTTNLNNTFTNGTLNANATTNITVSQTLAALNIGAGVEVTFGDGLSFADGPGKGAAFGGVAVVPEPGSLASLSLGLGMLLSLRRRRA